MFLCRASSSKAFRPRYRQFPAAYTAQRKDSASSTGCPYCDCQSSLRRRSIAAIGNDPRHGNTPLPPSTTKRELMQIKCKRRHPDSTLPPDPAILVPALERAGLPAGERDPQAGTLDDFAQAADRKPLEAKVMMRVPAHAPVPPRKPHIHIAQGKPTLPASPESAPCRRFALPCVDQSTNWREKALNKCNCR